MTLRRGEIGNRKQYLSFYGERVFEVSTDV